MAESHGTAMTGTAKTGSAMTGPARERRLPTPRPKATARAAFRRSWRRRSPRQLVSFAIACALLYVIVSKIALPRVRGLLAARQGMIDNDLAEAQAEGRVGRGAEGL